MKQEPVDFMETLVQQIIDQVKVEYTFLNQIKCEITKQAPPIAKFDGLGTSVSSIWQKINKEEHLIEGFEGGEILLDISYQDLKSGTQPLAIFVHGFKGFKDWGAFNAVSQQMAARGLAWCKFNFSRNGTTPDKPTEFADPEAFGNNNYGIELTEIGLVLDWVESSI